MVRIGTGVIWIANLGFVVDPSNMFFGSFGAVADSMTATSWIGPAIPQFAMQNAVLLAWLTGLFTLFMAVSLTVGLATRPACVAGTVFSGLIFLTQAGSTLAVPGGTDVGPHPLYIVIYAGLLLGAAGSRWSVDAYLRSSDLRGWRVLVGPSSRAIR